MNGRRSAPREPLSPAGGRAASVTAGRGRFFADAFPTAVLLAFAACGGEQPTTLEDPVASITVSPGNGTVTSIDATVSFSATARGASGDVLPDVVFIWSSSEPGVVTVNGAGVATSVGNGSAQVRASAGGVTGSATLTVAQEASALNRVDGDAQSAPVRGKLPAPLRVRVLDARANPIAGRDVTWEVLTGGGSIEGSPTDATGTSSATWTLGQVPGEATARARAGALSVTFTSDALPDGVIQGTVLSQTDFLSPPRLLRLARAALGRGEDASGDLSTGPRGALAGSAGVVPGELLVRLRADRLGLPGVGSQAMWVRARAEEAAVLMRRTASAWKAEGTLEVAGASPALATVRVRVPPGQEEAVRQRLLRRPEVAAVELNGLFRGAAAVHRAVRPVGARPVGRDTRMLRPPPIRRGTRRAPAEARDEPIFPVQAWHYDVIDALGAWEMTTGSHDVIVAVVDDGIRFDHPDIADNLRPDGYDFVAPRELDGCTGGTFTASMDGDGPDPDPTIPALLDYHSGSDCILGTGAIGGHGLHVAGTIAAGAGNAVGGVGLAWEVGIRPVRVLGSAGFGSFFDIAQGVLYAAGLPVEVAPGDVVQAATGAHVINMSLGGSSQSGMLEHAIEAATAAGSLVIAAAGNSNSSALFYPAAYPQVLSVSAVAPDLSRATYSNFGPTVDIAAPGGERQLGDDYGVWSLVWDFQNGTPAYASFHGTSMAAPHVSGVAALVLAANGGLGVSDLRARLVDHAEDIGPAGPDASFGAGLVQAGASVRGGPAPAPDTYVRVYDAQGAPHAPVKAAGDGSYFIHGLPDGEYRVYAGHDHAGDALTGHFDRRWGALGGSTTPTSVTITQSSLETASFDFGFPFESESNGTVATADPLPVGGYVYGGIGPLDVDLYRLDVAEPTDLVIETDALTGACGFAGQADTMVRLFDAVGVPMGHSDDVNVDMLVLCSRIETHLTAGTYYVEVTGAGSSEGSYAVRVSEGS